MTPTLQDVLSLAAGYGVLMAFGAWCLSRVTDPETELRVFGEDADE